MNKELMEALDVLEKEKEISKETLFEAIENSLMTACKNHFGKADNVHVEINRETCDFLVYAEKEVVPTKDDEKANRSRRNKRGISALYGKFLISHACPFLLRITFSLCITFSLRITSLSHALHYTQISRPARRIPSLISSSIRSVCPVRYRYPISASNPVALR